VLRQGPGPEGPRLPQDALEVRFERLVGRGMVEHLTIVNHSMAPVSFNLALEVGSDFADVLEVAQRRRLQTGDLRIDGDATRIEIRYVATSGELRTDRGLRIRVVSGNLRLKADGASASAQASADLDLAPRESWTATLAYQVLRNGRWATPVALTDGWRHGRPGARALARDASSGHVDERLDRERVAHRGR